MAVPLKMADLSTTAASNSPAGSEAPISTDDFHRAIQAILRTTNAKGSDIASASTTDIGAATAEFVDVTGTTTITGLGTIAAGIVRTVRFTGILTLTYNATSLILPGNANITTAANDIATFRSLGSGNWVCVCYTRRDGISITSGSLQAQTYTYFTTGGTSTAYTLTPTPAITSLVAGQRFNVVFNATCGATPTLAISGLTAKTLKVKDSAGAKASLPAGAIVANSICDVEYDGTDYVVLFGTLATDTTAGVVEKATTAEMVAGTAEKYVDAALYNANKITHLTTQVTTSGTAWDFTYPSFVKEINIFLNSFSTNGTSNYMIQIGDSGGIENSVYTSFATDLSNAAAVGVGTETIGFRLTLNITAASVFDGQFTLKLVDPATNKWALSGFGFSGSVVRFPTGVKTLSSNLTTVRVTTIAGTDTGDNGNISSSYL